MNQPDWLNQAREYVDECVFKDYAFRVSEDSRGAAYLQAMYWEDDTLTGKSEIQFTRRWFLSPEMSKSEIVSTVFKCIITSMEHRTREGFLYKNRAIFMPHFDVMEQTRRVAIETTKVCIYPRPETYFCKELRI